MIQLKNSKLFRQQCYVDGKWIDADDKSTFEIHNPFNDELIGKVPNCGISETKRAIDFAQQAYKSWSTLTAKQRCDIMLNWAKLIDENKEDLAVIMTTEQGKPVSEARGEMDYANSFIKWFAEECRRIYGDVIHSNKPNQHLIVIKQPIGVVGAITPWNFPSAMITRKCSPALAAGCPIVLKPASETPFSAFALAVLAEEAGFPAGVINILTGKAEDIGKELTTNSLVRKFSFTGSTEVGKLLMSRL